MLKVFISVESFESKSFFGSSFGTPELDRSTTVLNYYININLTIIGINLIMLNTRNIIV